jgi:pantetheine-phosphate adenylyltransferase
MLKVMLPGTFDPPTNGHLDILQRASRLFEAVVVVVAVNPGKANLFSSEERFGMMKALSADLPNVTVSLWDGLIVDYAAKHGIQLIVRGVRALADFDYEFELAAMNRSLNPRAETILLPTDQRYSVLRSSVVKDIARFGGTVSSMVPPIVAEALQRKLGMPAARAALSGTSASGAGDS